MISYNTIVGLAAGVGLLLVGHFASSTAPRLTPNTPSFTGSRTRRTPIT
jgi:hypothetical protein